MELNKQQNTASKKNDKSLMIIAGAGTGKTRVLVQKIINLIEDGIDGNRILALTFTNKAGDEMRQRISKSINSINYSTKKPFIGTFHSLCLSLLRSNNLHIDAEENFLVFDRDQCLKVVKQSIKKIGLDDTISPKNALNIISKLKTGLADEEDSSIIKKVSKILPGYQAILKRENAFDFDDLIIKAIELLKQKSIGDSIRNKYSHILVDEYQDTDYLQNELLSLLTNSNTILTVVGDTDQTIYSWRGADVDNLLSFDKRFNNVETIILNENYRSTNNILKAANFVISKNKLRQEKEIYSNRNEGNLINLIVAEDEENEGELVANKIWQLNNEGKKFEDIAILFRTNAQSRALERQMILNNIPYKVLGARFFDRAEIKDLLAYLTLINNKNSSDAYLRAISAPKRKIGKQTVEKLFNGESIGASMLQKVNEFNEQLRSFRDFAKENNITNTLIKIIKDIDYKEHLKKTYDNPDERFNEVEELLTFSSRFENLDTPTAINRILSEVALGTDQDTLRTMTKTKNVVKLMTIHSAKGLEFDTVFITGLEDGTFPIERGFEIDDQEEERRLCYVAITRAKNNLVLTCAKRRGRYGKYEDMNPSQFIFDIPDEIKQSGYEENNISW